MARIIYALSGEGRGHSSRTIAVANGLRRRGHTVRFCCGGTARTVLEKRGEQVIPVPALQHAMKGNRIQVLGTIKQNWRPIITAPETIERLCDTFTDYRPDLLITDFEAFSPRAAERLGVPIISFNHQQMVTETHYELPPEHWLDALVASLIIEKITPLNPAHILLTSFFFPSLKHPEYTNLVPPIIRPEVRSIQPTTKEHILVYYNHGESADQVLHNLSTVDASFVAYGFENSSQRNPYSNLQLKPPSINGFLEDLASSRAVICTAGFTLISEALYLGKPLLVVPNQGIFEQTLNALFLAKDGLGEQVSQTALTTEHIADFIKRSHRYANQLDHREACGNNQALNCIEHILSEISPNSYAVSSPQPAKKTDH